MNRSRQITKVLRHHGLNVKELCTGFQGGSNKTPYVVIDHTSYPGVEAHLFTSAHAALWNACFTPEHDVLLSHPTLDIDTTVHAWNSLTSSLSTIMNSINLYKTNINYRSVATVIWGHHETEWHRETWESRVHEYVPPSEFIDYVDPSIRPHITELNELGFATIESCSGKLMEHLDRDPYKPYVMFDERSYLGSAPHFFTLGDMAGWESMYAPHGFDVYIRVFTGDDIEAAWSRLLANARILSPLLSVYRKSVKQPSQSEPTGEDLFGEEHDDSTHHTIEDKARKMLGLHGIR
jgi:hypothetical protein